VNFSDISKFEILGCGKQARGLYSFSGHDLSAELEELRARLARAKEERATEARKVAMLVVEASNTLMDLGMLPIWEVP
jgi:hypothetical protein